MARVVVLGGYGNFGARICRALAEDSEFEVFAAGRSANRGLQLNLASPDFAARLRQISPNIVIHCAGPFQNQDYRVARAALAAGAHYIDLADGRDFVARFVETLDKEARAAERLAVSGASTLPALSCAVIDHLARRFRDVEEVKIAIAPGQRAPRGAATMAAVLGYCGRPFKWLSGGTWRDAWGWQELVRLRFAGFGTRWAAACDVPDLELLPTRYPGLRTVEFRAALEFAVQHFALWLAAGVRRFGVPLPLERWALPLDRLASTMDALGGERAGMLVSLTGTKPDGTRACAEWHLSVDALVGPEIPCLPAILISRKLVRGALVQRGAFACMGLLLHADFEPEFARWGIGTAIEERSA